MTSVTSTGDGKVNAQHILLHEIKCLYWGFIESYKEVWLAMWHHLETNTYVLRGILRMRFHDEEVTPVCL